MLKKTCMIFLIAGFSFACSKDSPQQQLAGKTVNTTAQSVKKNSVFITNKVGYIYEESFTRVNESEFQTFIINQLEIQNETVTFEDFTLTNVSGNTYAVKTKLLYNGTHTSFNHILNYDDTEDHYAMGGGSCSCTSSDCSQSGCEASSSSASDCSCSSCSGDCTKTHTIGSIAPPMFEE